MKKILAVVALLFKVAVAVFAICLAYDFGRFTQSFRDQETIEAVITECQQMLQEKHI